MPVQPTDTSELSVALTGSTLPPPSIEPPPIRRPAGSATATGSLAERIADRGMLETGLADAPLTLTIFTNPSCGYCRDFARDHQRRLEQEFVDLGKLKLRFIVTPLKKYPGSTLDAAAMLCGGVFGNGRRMHDALFDAGVRSRKSIVAIAQKLAMPTKQFASCLDAKETKSLLGQQAEFIREHAVTLLPAFLLSNGKNMGLPAEASAKAGLPSYADLRGRIRNARE